MSGSVQALIASIPSTTGIAFRSVGTLASGTGAITPGLPVGLQQNDFILYVIMAGNGGVTGPTGYTLTNSTTNSGLVIYYKVAGVSESAQSISTTGSGSVGTIAQVFAYSGANATPIDVQMTNNALGSFTTSSITTTAANDFVISVFGSTAPAGTWTAPGSTNVRATNNPNGTLRGLLIVDELQTASGASTARTATGTTTAGQAFALAIKV